MHCFQAPYRPACMHTLDKLGPPSPCLLPAAAAVLPRHPAAPAALPPVLHAPLAPQHEHMQLPSAHRSAVTHSQPAGPAQSAMRAAVQRTTLHRTVHVQVCMPGCLSAGCNNAEGKRTVHSGILLTCPVWCQARQLGWCCGYLPSVPLPERLMLPGSAPPFQSC